tara:strand:+ start:5011 stop:5859 length:849 start_codon:yes stop_codon:yes gene_type:complete
MKSYNSLKIVFSEALKGVYPINELDRIFFLILDYKLGWKKIDYILNRDKLSNAELLQFIDRVIPELKKNKPIQHILGCVSFYGLELKVNKDVLIPRPETEELVAKIISEINLNSSLSVLDIGTGSGCIPLALKHQCPNLVCSGIDVSIDALVVAKENAKRLGLDVSFSQQDIFKSYLTFNSIDIIVSNPPYIPNKEIASMGSNVVDYEPHSALFVEDANPLLFYDCIATIGRNILKDKGKIYFEIHEDYGDQVVNLLSDLNYSNISLFKDLQGKNRMIRASK